MSTTKPRSTMYATHADSRRGGAPWAIITIYNSYNNNIDNIMITIIIIIMILAMIIILALLLSNAICPTLLWCVCVCVKFRPPTKQGKAVQQGSGIRQVNISFKLSIYHNIQKLLRILM